MIKDDMAVMGAVLKSDVEEARHRIVLTIKRLKDTSQIAVPLLPGDSLIL